MTTEIKIDGMSCSHCVNRIETALKRINGVKTVDISLEGKTALVEHDETILPALLFETVTETGFDVLN